MSITVTSWILLVVGIIMGILGIIVGFATLRNDGAGIRITVQNANISDGNKYEIDKNITCCFDWSGVWIGLLTVVAASTAFCHPLNSLGHDPDTRGHIYQGALFMTFATVLAIAFTIISIAQVNKAIGENEVISAGAGVYYRVTGSLFGLLTLLCLAQLLIAITVIRVAFKAEDGPPEEEEADGAGDKDCVVEKAVYVMPVMLKR